MISPRIDWLDALKALGILFIVVGHLGDHSGNLYNFVYLFHVPLFFFAAGFLYKRSESIKLIVIYKSKSLLLPYFYFSLIGSGFYYLTHPASDKGLIDYLFGILFGIRNSTFYGEALWFFPCLFLTILFYTLLDCFFKKSPHATLITCFILYYAITIIPNEPPSSSPQLPFNADSALYYLVYFSIGRAVNENREKISIIAARISFRYLFTFISLFVCVVFYTYGSSWAYALPIRIPVINATTNLLITSSLIFSMATLSIIVSKIRIIPKIGKATLMICGLEAVSRGCILMLTDYTGVPLNINTPVSAVLFALLIIIFSSFLGAAMIKTIQSIRLYQVMTRTQI